MSLINQPQGAQPSTSKGELSSSSSKEGRTPSQEPTVRTSYEDRPFRAPSSIPPKQAGSDFVSALKLVQRASEAIDMLQNRCRQLETDVKDTNDRLKSEAESSERVIKDWERLANAIKTQLSKSEARVSELEQRLRTTEERAVALEARAQTSEARVQAAEQLAAQEGELASTFRDTILETFGSGSRLSTAIGGSGH